MRTGFCLVLVGIALTGCGNSDVRDSTLVGAGLGALVGASVGNSDDAIVGGIVGGVAGAVVGNVAQDRRSEYTRAKTDLEAAIEAANGDLEASNRIAVNAQERLRVERSVLASIEAQQRRGRERTLAAQASAGRLEREISSLETEKNRLDQQLAYYDRVLRGQNSLQSTKGQLTAEIRNLEQKRRLLEDQFYELNGLQREMRITRNSLYRWQGA